MSRCRSWLSGWGIIVVLYLLVACSSGGDGNGDTPTIVGTDGAVACLPSGDDSTQNSDGSASFTRSHTTGSPLYHSVITRKNSLNQDITLDYMVHQPTGTPKGIVVLIAGGALTANISGTEGSTVTGSGGNFLVRSAHRFMQAGYRVITMDRPSDFANYGDIDNASYLYDAYRTSANHAVDIATIVNRENSDNLPVLITGTSRGAISAVAQNALAMGIAISSPVTRSSAGGAPIGSAALPVDVMEVPVHVLYHQNDGCSSTQPNNTLALINQLANANVDVAGNHVSGGFVDTVSNNPCGAFGYHGFLGIENCAVTTTTAWIDKFLAAIETAHPGNARPVAQSQSTSTAAGQEIDITLSATDADDTNLVYALPFAQSILSGSVSISGNTVHYVPPPVAMPVTDSFVFTVQDSKGSRSAAVVSVSINTLFNFDHNSITDQTCADCHLSDKPLSHINSTDVCDACHNTSTWITVSVDHNHVIGTCESCHDGVIARGKGANHMVTTQPCDVCHTTTSWLMSPFDHSIVAGQACVGCHDGVNATYKSVTHPITTNQCEACHSTLDWVNLIVPFDHTQTVDTCVSCHDNIITAGKGDTHPATNDACEACHSTTNWLQLLLPFDHDQADTTTCVTSGCHSESDKTANHPSTTLDCSVCHVTTGWLPVSTPP